MGFRVMHHRQDTEVRFCQILHNAISSYVENVIVILPLIGQAGILYEIPKSCSSELISNDAQHATITYEFKIRTIMTKLRVNLRVPANASQLLRAKNKVTCKTLRDNSTLVLLHYWFAMEKVREHTIWSKRLIFEICVRWNNFQRTHS